jgi:hypothetical protein
MRQGRGLYAWMHKHSELIPHILGGLNIDEIGVDQEKGNSILHLFKPPAANPSCTGPLLIHICENILSPEIRWKPVADRAEIINDTITSDPNMDIPLPCLIQYPSLNYHSSADTVDTLSADVMKKTGLASAIHLYFLASSGLKEAEWLSKIVASENRKQLDLARIEIKERKWPFSKNRSEEWFKEQFSMSAVSIERFGLPADKVKIFQKKLSDDVDRWSECLKSFFPKEIKRKNSKNYIDKAAGAIFRRTTKGAPKALGSFKMSPEEEKKYKKILFENNFDLLFHRLLYWVDGKRTLLDIIERLEFELKELMQNTSISRTASGFSIEEKKSYELDIEGIIYITDKIVAGGYLEKINRERV